MSENKETYETTTNLLTVENIVDYLWMKVDHPVDVFKPLRSKDIKIERTYGDLIEKDAFLKKYYLSKEDIKNMGLKDEEYAIDNLTFKIYDENKVKISDGNLLLLSLSDKKFYVLFLMIDDTPKLLMKCSQKKAFPHLYPTEKVEFF